MALVDCGVAPFFLRSFGTGIGGPKETVALRRPRIARNNSRYVLLQICPASRPWLDRGALVYVVARVAEQLHYQEQVVQVVLEQVGWPGRRRAVPQVLQGLAARS